MQHIIEQPLFSELLFRIWKMACFEHESLMADVAEDASRDKERKEGKSKQPGLSCALAFVCRRRS